MQKKVVSVRAMMGRLNRALSAEGVVLKKNRPNSVQPELGTWYTVKGDYIEATQIDLERLAKDYDCLKEYEELEQE